ncbi:MAG: radical SAM family heme chaperone HemW [Cytophagales bacterium]
MAGLYLHIPFCKHACYYCDFHFSTNRQKTDQLVKAIGNELRFQKEYLGGEAIETIYFGGGTPSLLTYEQISFLLTTIKNLFAITETPEVTLEANPDDLTSEKLKALRTAGINRLSIGIQSFDDTILRFFNRAHNAAQAEKCIRDAHVVGFTNLNLDLIFGAPYQTMQTLERDLSRFIDLAPEHISAYSLTIEEKTVFGHQLKNGTFSVLPEGQVAEQFKYIMKRLEEEGYEQYEISNFCRPGYYSKHNTSYWQQKKYLGVGPSAHSYDGQSRQWNVANNQLYIRSLAQGTVPFEREMLTRTNQINEYFFTTLRTRWGTDLTFLRKAFDFTPDPRKINMLKNHSLIKIENERLTLTLSGKLLADKIALEFFIDEG